MSLAAWATLSRGAIVMTSRTITSLAFMIAPSGDPGKRFAPDDPSNHWHRFEPASLRSIIHRIVTKRFRRRAGRDETASFPTIQVVECGVGAARTSRRLPAHIP